MQSESDDCATRWILPIIISESMGPNFPEPIDGNLSSCDDEWINDYSTGDLHGAALQRQPEALPNAAEIVDVDATNNRAHHSGVFVFNSEKKDDSTQPNLVGQNPSSSTASHSNQKRARETAVGERINSITKQDLEQYFGRTRKEAAESLGVSVSTLKRICRRHGIKQWPRRIRSTDERNACPTLKPSTHGQTQMDGHLHKPNEVQPEFFDGVDDDMKLCFSSICEEMPSENPGSADLASSQLVMISEILGSSDFASSQLTMESQIPVSSELASSQLTMGEIPGLTVTDTGTTIPDTGPIAPQDAGPVAVTKKAEYKGLTIKFPLPPTAGLTELNEIVATRLNLELDSFHVKYTDGEGDLISMTGDENLREYLELCLVNPRLKLLVCDRVVNAD